MEIIKSRKMKKQIQCELNINHEIINIDRLVRLIFHFKNIQLFKQDEDRLKILKAYYNNFEKGDYKAIYNQHEYKGLKYGRYFIMVSPHDESYVYDTYKRSYYIGSIKSEVRNFISSEYCTDIDIINCFPVLLQQLTKKLYLNCDELDYYINNRSEILSKYNVTKKQVCILMFDGDLSNRDYRNILEHDFFQKLHNFIHGRVFEALKMHNDYKNIYEAVVQKEPKKSKTPNLSGKFISTVLQDIEADIIKSVLDYTKKENIKTCAYMYDGLLLYKNDKLDDKFLKKISDLVFLKHDYKVNFVYKPMDYPKEWDELPNAPDEFKKELKYNDYILNLIKEINKIYVKIENVEPPFYNIKTKLFHKNSQVYEHLRDFKFVTSKETFEYDLEKYFDSELKRKYKKIDFIPPPIICPDDVFNTWVPLKWSSYKYSNEDQEYIQLKKAKMAKKLDDYLNHISSGNEYDALFIKKSMATKIQKPGVKTGTCRVIKGKQGGGRGTMCDFMSPLFINNEGYNYFYQTSEIEDVLGTYNKIGLQYKLWIVLDEAIGKEVKGYNSKLKNLITEKTVSINEKNQPKFPILNCFEIEIHTNFFDAILLEDGQRRNYIINPEKMSETVLNLLRNEEGLIYEDEDDIKAMFDVLLDFKVDYNTINDWQKALPKNEAYNDLKDYQVDCNLLWLYEFLLKMKDSKDDKPLKEDLNNIYSECYHDLKYNEKLTDNVCDNFSRYMCNNNSKFEFNRHSFQCKLTNGSLFPKNLIERERSKKDERPRYYIFDVENIIKYIEPKIPEYMKMKEEPKMEFKE